MDHFQTRDETGGCGGGEGYSGATSRRTKLAGLRRLDIASSSALSFTAAWSSSCTITALLFCCTSTCARGRAQASSWASLLTATRSRIFHAGLLTSSCMPERWFLQCAGRDGPDH